MQFARSQLYWCGHTRRMCQAPKRGTVDFYELVHRDVYTCSSIVFDSTCDMHQHDNHHWLSRYTYRGPCPSERRPGLNIQPDTCTCMSSNCCVSHPLTNNDSKNIYFVSVTAVWTRFRLARVPSWLQRDQERSYNWLSYNTNYEVQSQLWIGKSSEREQNTPRAKRQGMFTTQWWIRQPLPVARYIHAAPLWTLAQVHGGQSGVSLPALFDV